MTKLKAALVQAAREQYEADGGLEKHIGSPEFMTGEHCAVHQQVSLDLDALANELRAMKERMREIRRVLRTSKHEGLRKMARSIHIELEVMQLSTMEAAKHE